MKEILKDKILKIIPVLEEYKIQNAAIGSVQGRGTNPEEYIILFISIENIEQEFINEKKHLLLKEHKNPLSFAYEIDNILTYELEDLLNLNIEIIIVSSTYMQQLSNYQEEVPNIILIQEGTLIDKSLLDIKIKQFFAGIKSISDVLLKSYIPNIFATLASSIPRMEYIATLDNFLNPAIHKKSKYIFSMRDRVLQDYFRAYKDILEISKTTDLSMGMTFYEERCNIINNYCKDATTTCIRKMIGDTPFILTLSDELLRMVWEDHHRMKDYSLECVYQSRKLAGIENRLDDAIDFINSCKNNKSRFLSQDLDLYEKRLNPLKIKNRELFKQVLNM